LSHLLVQNIVKWRTKLYFESCLTKQESSLQLYHMKYNVLNLILVIVVFFLMYHLIKWDKLLYRIYTMFLCSCLNGKPEQMHNVYTLQQFQSLSCLCLKVELCWWLSQAITFNFNHCLVCVWILPAEGFALWLVILYSRNI
jgi:hypothetical protein